MVGRIERMSISVTQRYIVAEARRGMVNLEYLSHQLRKRESLASEGAVRSRISLVTPQWCSYRSTSFSTVSSGMPIG